MSETRNSSLEWLRYAQSDLAYSKVSCPPGGLLETLCFHAQQASEKALKAVLIHLEVPFPKTHNINTLLELLPQDIDVPDEVKSATILTDYAVISRYPGEYEPLSFSDARQAVRLARRVRREIRKLLPKSTLRRRRRK